METRKEKLMRELRCTEQEALDIIKYDEMIDKGLPVPFDLSKEDAKIAAKFANTGTKTQKTEKTTRNRKENATKAEIISKLSEFLTENVAENTILNPERQISFILGEETYELTLIQKRKAKKWERF